MQFLARLVPTALTTPVHTKTRSRNGSTGVSYPSKPETQPRPVLRMLMFGKPGAGKGTLSARLVKKYEMLSLSTGDLLRSHIAERYTSFHLPRVLFGSY
jgi:hypothetical protein